MAKKKVFSAATDNMPGIEAARKEHSEDTIKTLSTRLVKAIEASGKDVNEYLAEQFNVSAEQKPVNLKGPDGNVYEFYEVIIPASDVSDKFHVDFEINGREQELLTPERLKRLNSIKTHQYYPLIGFFDEKGINVVDGSRRLRRYQDLGADYPLRALVSTKPLTREVAMYFAKDIQSAKEKTLRDNGLLWRHLMDVEDYTRAEIAESNNVSVQTVKRALRAASIPLEIVKELPDDIGVRQYETIYKLYSDEFKRDVDSMVESIQILREEAKDEDIIESEDLVRYILNKLKPGKASSNEVEQLFTFDDKKKKATKKKSKQGVIYNFKGISEKQIADIELAIKQVLEK